MLGIQNIWSYLKVICMVLEVSTYYTTMFHLKKKKDYTTTFCTFVSNNMSVLWLYKRLTLFFFNWGGYMSVCEPCWSWGGSVNNNDYFGFFHLVELNHVQPFELLKFQSFSILLMMFVLLIIYTVQDIINFCFQKI